LAISSAAQQPVRSVKGVSTGLASVSNRAAMAANSARVTVALGRKLPSSYPDRMPMRERVAMALLYQAPADTSG